MYIYLFIYFIYFIYSFTRPSLINQLTLSYSQFKMYSYIDFYISQADKQTLKNKKIDAVSCEEEGSGGDTDILTGSSSSENNDPLLIAESSDTEQGVYADDDYINPLPPKSAN